MSEIVISSSSNSDDREIDEYHDSSSSNGSNGCSSSGGNTMDEQYMFGVPGVPLEVLQEELWMKAISGSHASSSTNVPSSSSSSEKETVFSCAIGVPSKTDEKRLTSLRSWYQIPNELNP